MKNYDAPQVMENPILLEGAYASSGYVVENNGSANLIWSNQNSGSHSDLSLMVKTGEQAGEYFRVTITYVGSGTIQYGGFSGGYTDMSVSGNSLTFVREGHYNANENFQFSINNCVFSELKEGYTGDGQHSGARYPSGEMIKEDAIKSGDFVIDYQMIA